MYLSIKLEIDKLDKQMLKAVNNPYKTVQLLKEISSADYVALLYYDSENKFFYDELTDLKISLGFLEIDHSSIIGNAYKNKQIYWSKYIPFDTNYNTALDNPFNLKINSQILLPVFSNQQIKGIARFSKKDRTFTNEDHYKIEAIYDSLLNYFIAVENKKYNPNLKLGFDPSDAHKNIRKIKKHIKQLKINQPEIQKLITTLNENVENLSAYIDSFSTQANHEFHNRDETKNKNLHVLIADDVHMNVKILDAMIKQENISNISFAYDGEETCEQIKRLMSTHGQFNVLFLDHHMPKKLGSEIIKHIRDAKRENPSSKTVVVSITNDPQAIETYKDYYDYHLPKPFRKSDISNIVSQILDQYAAI